MMIDAAAAFRWVIETAQPEDLSVDHIVTLIKQLVDDVAQRAGVR